MMMKWRTMCLTLPADRPTNPPTHRVSKRMKQMIFACRISKWSFSNVFLFCCCRFGDNLLLTLFFLLLLLSLDLRPELPHPLHWPCCFRSFVRLKRIFYFHKNFNGNYFVQRNLRARKKVIVCCSLSMDCCCCSFERWVPQSSRRQFIAMCDWVWYANGETCSRLGKKTQSDICGAVCIEIL